MSTHRRNQNAGPRVIVLTQSDQWSSAIRRALHDRGHAPKTSFVIALNWQDLLSETRARPASVAAIELNEKNLLTTCRQVHAVANNPYSTRFLSLAKTDLRQNEILFRQFGFASCFWTVIHAKRLIKVAERLALQLPPDSQTIEQAAWSQLPWKAPRQTD